MKTLPISVPEETKVSEPLENENQRILREALMRLENGKKWCKHALDRGVSVCARGAVNVAIHGVPDWHKHDRRGDLLSFTGHHKAHKLLDAAACELRPDLNRGAPSADLNNEAASFSEVRAMFNLAIQLAATP